jgi:hypothetical protein
VAKDVGEKFDVRIVEGVEGGGARCVEAEERSGGHGGRMWFEVIVVFVVGAKVVKIGELCGNGEREDVI